MRSIRRRPECVLVKYQELLCPYVTRTHRAQSKEKETGQGPRYGHGRASAGILSRGRNQFMGWHGPLLNFGPFGPILATYQRKASIDLLSCLPHRWSVPCVGCPFCRSGRWGNDASPIRSQHRIVCCCGCCPSCCYLCSWSRKNHLINRHKYPLCSDRFSPILAIWEGHRSSPALHPFSLIPHA